MLHDTPMSFLWLGAMLERVGQTARILDMHHHTMNLESAHQIVEMALWLSLLRACSGYEAFVKKNQGRATASAVVSFLLFDGQFPRSLRYCLRSARQILQGIWPQAPAGAAVAPIGRRSFERLDALGRWLDERESSFTPAGIHQLLTHVVDEVGAICSHIGQEILGPPRPPPRLTQSQSQ
jgi:uncharacterized alpha-E superfamily protein